MSEDNTATPENRLVQMADAIYREGELHECPPLVETAAQPEYAERDSDIFWEFDGSTGPVFWLHEAIGADGIVAGGAPSWIVVEISNDEPTAERDRAIVFQAASVRMLSRDIFDDEESAGHLAKAGERVLLVARNDIEWPPITGLTSASAHPAAQEPTSTAAPATSGELSMPGSPPLQFGGVEYFRITNPRIAASVKQGPLGKWQERFQEAIPGFERLSDFLQSMGCVTVVSYGGWPDAASTICGGMFVDPIASSPDHWTEIMEGLLPPDKGWQFSTAFRGQTERDEDGDEDECRLNIEIKLEIGLLEVDDFDHHIEAFCPPDLAVRLARWEKSGRSIDIYPRLGRRQDRAQGGERVGWLVNGLIPKGMVVLMGGARESGKSTMMLELAVAIAMDQPNATTWLGQPLDPRVRGGMAVLLTGEDTDAIIYSRLEYLDPHDQAAGLAPYSLDGRPLADIVAEIARIPNLRLVVVDPARRYIQGDEDGSGSVNDFFAVLETLVQQTGATVIVVHHLTKSAAPTSLQQVRDTIRGSGVFLDRPRLVLGCFRRGETTIVGPVKSNLPPDCALVPEIHLRRDEPTLRHEVESGGTEHKRNPAGVDDVQDKVLAAVRRLSAAGEKLMRAGDSELWARQPAELQGVGRKRIRDAVDKLIEDGLLENGPNGIVPCAVGG